jgi:DNA-binding response OmpR family regulator
MRILVAEDDARLAALLEQSLAEAGGRAYAVDCEHGAEMTVTVLLPAHPSRAVAAADSEC